MVSLSPEKKRQRKNLRGDHGWFLSAPRSYNQLLDVPVIKNWIDDYTSSSTRSGYLYAIQFFFGFVKMGPNDVLRLSEGEIKQLIHKACQSKIQQGKHASAQKLSLAVCGFCDANGIYIRLRRRDRIRVPKTKIRHEMIPDVDDIYKLAEASKTPRNKALILCLWQSGVRAGCICSWKFKHVKKFLYPEIGLPVRIKITSELDSKISSYGLGYYYAFLSDPAVTALKDYLEFRKHTQDWQPQDDDFLFVTWGTVSRGQQFHSKNIWEIVKRAAWRAGFDPSGVWTHVLRKSFRKVLNRQPFDEDTKETLMGHRLPGSRGSYFDFHDVQEIQDKYMGIDWSRPGDTRLDHMATALKKTTEELEALRPLKTQIETLSRQVEELQKIVRRPPDKIAETLRPLGLVAEFKRLKIRRLDTKRQIVEVLDLDAFATAAPGRSEASFIREFTYKDKQLEQPLFNAISEDTELTLLIKGNGIIKLR